MLKYRYVAIAVVMLMIGVGACSGEEKSDETDSDTDESESASEADDDADDDEMEADAGRPRDAGGGTGRDGGRPDAGMDRPPTDGGTGLGGSDSDAAPDTQSDAGAMTASCETDAEPLPSDVALPIVFIHGFAGSAQQYESQAMRFVANGYPRERIRALDHDGEGFDTSGFISQADALVDEVLSEFEVDKVYLVGHSRGTFVSDGYLGDAGRAAKVAKYISLDGAGCSAAMSAGVPCIAPSQSNLPGQAHVEVATSAESFKRQFEFLVGTAPNVVDLTPQDAPVEISGRAVNFPANTGRGGTTLEIWELDEQTGHRAGAAPVKSFDIDDSGDWGPAVVDPRKHYELTLVASGSNHHFYPQPFLRCNHLVRLLSGPPDSESRMNTNKGDGHAAVVAMRMREWMTSDVLEISTASPSGDEPAVNAIVSSVGNANIAIFLHDDTRTPGESSLGQLSAFSGGAFQTGVDVFMPASDPPDGTITFTNMPRGETGKPQVLKIPNWASSAHAVTVMFADFPHP